MSKTNKPPYFMIIIMMIGSFIALLNNSLMNNALPTIMDDLNLAEYSTVQWLTNGYMLVMGVLIPTSAFFIKKYSTRSIFLASMIIFTLGTVIGIFAPNFTVLLIARIVQAAGAALLSPLLMNVMFAVFTPKQRGTAMGLYGLVVIVAPAFGPTISGYLLENYSWRSLFIVIAPIAALSVLLSVWKLKNVLEQTKAFMDVLSLILSTLGFALLLYGASNASSKGWGDSVVLACLIIGAVALILFVVRQLKINEPLMDVRVYKYPMFALGSVLSVLTSMILYSAMLLLPMYFQKVQEFSPMKAGLILLPGSLAMGFIMPIAGRLFDKLGIRPLVWTGFPLLGVSLFALTKLEIDTSLSYTVFWFIVFSVACALVMMPITTNSLNQLPQKLNSSGVAINSTLQQVAGAVGSAIFVTVMTNFAKVRGEELMKERTAEIGNDIATYSEQQMATFQYDLTQQAMLEAINHTMYVGIWVLLVALVVSLFVKTSSRD